MLPLKRIIRRMKQFIFRLFNKNKDFTIIANNCIAEGIYEDFDIKYLTPTIGLFFYSECYIRFLENFEFYIKQPLHFTDVSKYEKVNIRRKKEWYPVGILNNEVEIQFLHYKDEKEALEKWNRRKERINFKNIFFINTDRDDFKEEYLIRYEKLPFKKKVFFSSKDWGSGYKTCVFIKEYKNEPYIGDLLESRAYEKHFNIVKWLNS